jgi:sugar phosphate isomerase/epimerase
MKQDSKLSSRSRRKFLKSASTVFAAASIGGPVSGLVTTTELTGAFFDPSESLSKRRKLPIGVFDVAFYKMPVEAMAEKLQNWQVEAVEIATGGYPGSPHCPLDALLNDAEKARAWKRTFEDRNIRVATLSCHGNPIHPVSKIADRDVETFKRTVLLAERLGVEVIVGFSGCPAGSPNDTMPNWITYQWPPEYAQMIEWQWKEKVIPYWKEAAKFARDHGIHKIALEMHPNFVVYNPLTLLKLRDAVGEEIGANLDLSHLFWQQCDPIEVIHVLGKQGAIYHAHMKDTTFYKDNLDKFGVFNFAFKRSELPLASETFRSVGYGHSLSLWKEIVRAYMDTGYQGILSIENEDPILPVDVSVRRVVELLRDIRAELLNE